MLSVAGFLAVTGLFPYWERFIPGVKLDRPEQGVLHIPGILIRRFPYVPDYQLLPHYEDQAARDRYTSPTVKRVMEEKSISQQ